MDVAGTETDKVFNLVLRNLASTAPPIPGFRRQKGGQLSCFSCLSISIHVLSLYLSLASFYLFFLQKQSNCLFSYQMAQMFLKILQTGLRKIIHIIYLYK